MARLPRMTKDLAEKIVRCAIRAVGSLPANAKLESISFQHFNAHMKNEFAAALKECCREQRGDRVHYEIRLRASTIKGWKTLQDCADYVYDNCDTALN